jgi:hypothetical protein
MKVIYKMKNIPNKDCQHWMKSQLIEVMNMKMQMIQFMLIVNLIHMQLMKVIYKMKNIPNKECQIWMESQLIEQMRMRKQLIQFVSIANLSQTKLTNQRFQDNHSYEWLMMLNKGRSDWRID